MIVLDCSAAVEMVRGTERGGAFERLMLEGESVIASELLKVEVRNVFWKYVHAKLMTAEQAEERVRIALSLVDEFVPLEENAAEAFAEAVRQNHSVYDMLYLTLVRRNAATLFSADRKLVELCERMGLDCVTEMPIEVA